MKVRWPRAIRHAVLAERAGTRPDTFLQNITRARRLIAEFRRTPQHPWLALEIG
jgi:hypothetical protein